MGLVRYLLLLIAIMVGIAAFLFVATLVGFLLYLLVGGALAALS